MWLKHTAIDRHATSSTCTHCRTKGTCTTQSITSQLLEVLALPTLGSGCWSAAPSAAPLPAAAAAAAAGGLPLPGLRPAALPPAAAAAAAALPPLAARSLCQAGSGQGAACHTNHVTRVSKASFNTPAQNTTDFPLSLACCTVGCSSLCRLCSAPLCSAPHLHQQGCCCHCCCCCCWCCCHCCC